MSVGFVLSYVVGHLGSETDGEEHGAVSDAAVARSLVVASAPSSRCVASSANDGIFGKCRSAFLLLLFFFAVFIYACVIETVEHDGNLPAYFLPANFFYLKVYYSDTNSFVMNECN